MKAWLKKNQWKILLPVLIVAVLTVAFYIGGDAPGLRGWKTSAPAAVQNTAESDTAKQSAKSSNGESKKEKTAKTTVPAAPKTIPAEKKTELGSQTSPQTHTAKNGMTADQKLKAAKKIAGKSSANVEKGDITYSKSKGMVIDPSTGKDQYQTDPVPEGKPLPVEPQDVKVTNQKRTCTLSISCASILDHMDWLDPEKKELVPKNGWILKPTQVTFYQGESVFNVLLRTCKQKKIHMEYENTPMYNSAYIEGIHNLYEFDCGELSGWMYRVDHWFPNYGCSRYQLKDGDTVDWVYTCNLGIDVGGYSAAAEK